MNNTSSAVFLTEEKSYYSLKSPNGNAISSASLNHHTSTHRGPLSDFLNDDNNSNSNKNAFQRESSLTKSLVELKRANADNDYYDINSKPIFISYEPNCNLQEKKFLIDLINQLKDNSLQNDIWFDKDEVLIGGPSWTINRLNSIDSSLGSILIITPSFFENQLTALESDVAYDLKCSKSSYYLAVIIASFKIYHNPAKMNGSTSSNGTNGAGSTAYELEKNKKTFMQTYNILQPLLDKCDLYINLNDKNLFELSLSEKVSHCVGCLTPHLEKISNYKPIITRKRPSANHTSHSSSQIDAVAYQSSTPNLSKQCRNCIVKGYTCNKCLKAYMHKKFISLSYTEIQYLLEDVRIDEFYRMNLADLQIDGFMLISCTEDDLIHIFDMDNKALRRRLKNVITDILKEELKSSDNWHLHLRSMKSVVENSVYVIFDPNDQHNVLALFVELKANEIQPFYHTSNVSIAKETYMREDGVKLAQCKNIIVFLTENTVKSYSVLYECLFAQLILNKTKFIVVMMKNVWKHMRSSLKAILGDQLAFDFTTNNLKVNFKQLIKVLKQRVNYHEQNFVMEKDASEEQSYKSLFLLSTTLSTAMPMLDKISVSISQVTDQWDTQHRLEQLLATLEKFNIKCWFDSASGLDNRHNKKPLNSKGSTLLDDYKKIQSSQKLTAQVLISCITQKYLLSDICVKDLSLAEQLNIPIVPILLKPCAWPPDGINFQVKRILMNRNCIDISNSTLLKRNLPKLISTIHHYVNKTN